MAPVRSKKRISDQRPASPLKKAMAEMALPRTGSPSAHPRSPIKKRTPGAITMQQKQAMIDNMQLEITERARRLRAQYNYMATTVRSRIEMRLNRVPMSMRKVKMGDLLQKFLEQEQQRTARSAALRKPPTTTRLASPQKQIQPAAHVLKPATRTKKRMSDAISGDKENEIEHDENAKKRVRGAPNTDVSHVRPAQILSPTSSNSRMANRSRPVSPVKSGIARPASPLKNPAPSRTAAATNMLSSMVEKAKATRAGVTRKVTTTSTTSSSSTSTTAATRNRRAPASTASRVPASRPATRTARRSIANSETSEASSGTVIRKGAAAKSTAAKKGTAASTRKATTTGTTRKATTTKTNTSAATTGTGRVLRKRG
ncbi:hypothetical protein NW762_000853 [Fusarium torreyae]|uniref:Borealin N-terminal domain-containing protein n=1 Tax=Fusarium torreyae TaxID=1237075 RepID=A0A9W8SH77_9HYPO|nr:hypothetical protein NW762_000853 [Fusarium torreyae]